MDCHAADHAVALRLQKELDDEYGAGSSDDDVALVLATSQHTEDEALAKQLQQELDAQHTPLPGSSSLNTSLSLVDERWEVLDPNPEVRALFLQFNERFFHCQLSGCEVRWSPRMTLCAGLCCYEGRGGLCSIRLSTPLLKLRPRKDLVETLLHEMIHAYLFVTDNNKDHDGHGPEFCKHMNRINSETGTKISIYHSFHEEVNLYRQHWWRCNGSCQKRKPYFGYVKRAMNRAPSARDTWWADHERTCGGVYTKIKEPEDYGKKKSKKKDSSDQKDDIRKKTKPSNTQDITKFFGKGKSLLGETVKAEGKKTRVGPVVIQSPSEFTDLSDVALEHRPSSARENVLPESVETADIRREVIQARSKFLERIENKSKSNVSAKKTVMSNSKPKLQTTANKGTLDSMFTVQSAPKTAVPEKKPRHDSSNIAGTSHPVPCIDISESGGERRTCPVCQTMVQESLLNSHLDRCLEAF